MSNYPREIRLPNLPTHIDDEAAHAPRHAMTILARQIMKPQDRVTIGTVLPVHGLHRAHRGNRGIAETVHRTVSTNKQGVELLDRLAHRELAITLPRRGILPRLVNRQLIEDVIEHATNSAKPLAEHRAKHRVRRTRDRDRYLIPGSDEFRAQRVALRRLVVDLNHLVPMLCCSAQAPPRLSEVGDRFIPHGSAIYLQSPTNCLDNGAHP